MTGAAGFIGSCMVGYLNRKGFYNITIVDAFDNENKMHNYEDKKIAARVERDNLFNWLQTNQPKIDFVFHLGARTDTTEFDYSVLEKLNVEYSQKIWHYCAEKNIPMLYASSAATYGDGELGYKDDHALSEKLDPLNPYGKSKNEFDKWVLKQDVNTNTGKKMAPTHWYGLKFFNVYGPNEYHKGRMASVIFHSFNQINKTGKVKLFKSHKKGYNDGEQLRDFIYVQDVVDICFWLMTHLPISGLYNVGTGKARTFNDLVGAIFKGLDKETNIEYIDTPIDIRDKYQYFTEADMSKIQAVGYSEEPITLEEGVATYVKNFLIDSKYY